MTRRSRLVALGASTLTLSASLLAACSSYDDPDSNQGTGGTSGTGTGGSGGTATGGSSGTATGGSGGMATGGAGAGGTAGSGTATGGSPSGGAGGGSGANGGSGGAGKASCENVTACGGDVVGTWTVAASCLPVSGIANMEGFGLGCSEAPVTGSLQVTGAFTVNAGGTYSDNTTTTGSEEIELPASCLTVSGTTTTCDRVGAPLQALGFASVTCVDNTASGGCTCSATVNQTGGMGFISLDAATSGTFATADDTLVTTAFGIDTVYPYCVSGTTLTLSVGTIGKAGTVSGTIVLDQ